MKVIKRMPDGSSMIHSMVPSLNRLPPHASFMPAEQEVRLDGDWDFHYYEHLTDLPDELPLADMTWDCLPVPSCWQLHGYGKPKYINIRYEFEPDAKKLTPPNVPAERTAVGVYRHCFAYPQQKGKRIILALDGYSSCVQAYMNGHFVGYAANGRPVTEFDVTDALHDRENELVLLVYQFGAGSFLECQDMWRLSGLFRSVRIYSLPEVSIRDVYVWCSLERDFRHATVHAEVKIHNAGSVLADPVTIHCELVDREGRSVASGGGHTGNLSDRFDEFTFFSGPMPIQAGVTRTAYSRLEISDPHLWSADDPYLYRMVIHAGSQCVTLPCGIRDVRMENGRFLVNGVPIKLKGVNRHEFSPEGGYTITREEMIRDIRLMKQANINAVRCSHYTQAPEWYALCDEYGLYVMDEANVESHGISYRGNVLPGNDLRWLPHLMNRVTAMVECQKNHPSVVIWSIGNELGFGECVAAAAGVIRGLDTRPIHKRQMNSIADMDSETYPTVELMRAHAEKKPGRAFLTNEYAHAMGNACGSLGEYWDAINADPTLIGGFVWEWMDHGLKGGPWRYNYGGDFQEEFHDSNFCLDGLIQPNGAPTAKLAELKKVHENVTITWDIAQSEVIVTNRFPHTSLDAYQLVVRQEAEGQCLAEQTEALLGIGPGKCRHIAISLHASPKEKETVLTVSVQAAHDMDWCDAGHEIAWSQFPLTSCQRVVPLRTALGAACRKQAEGEQVTLPGGAELHYLPNGTMTYRRGPVCLSGIGLNVMRAPTDNDLRADVMRVSPTWLEQGLHHLKASVEDFAFDAQTATVRRHITYQGNGCAFHIRQTDWLSADDAVFMDVEIRAEGTTVLPRIGLHLTAEGCWEDLTWYGLGPWETYPDRARCGKLGVYHGRLHEQQGYVKPQEYGAHMGCRYMQLRKGRETLSLVVPVPCTMGALPYSMEALMTCMHIDELPETNRTYLTVDYAQHGLGNRSCGPDVMPAYRLETQYARFGLLLTPHATTQALCPEALRGCYHPYTSSTGGAEESYRDPSDLDRQKAVGLVKDEEPHRKGGSA